MKEKRQRLSSPKCGGTNVCGEPGKTKKGARFTGLQIPKDQ